jgi:hypothetical protein
MKLPVMTMVAGIATLGWVTAARAQNPYSAPAPATQLPPSTPDVDEPVSPATPVVPGTLPPLATPSALPPPAPLVPAPAAPYEGEAQPTYPVFLSKMGSAIMLGGGFEDFTQSVPKSTSTGGGSWNLRLAAGTRKFVGLEAAYVGSARNVQVLGGPTNTTLVSNGAEGALRINVPIVAGLTLLEPFGFAGIGWQHYNMSRAAVGTADIATTDDVMTVPYGAGFMVSRGLLMLDARATWHETYYNDIYRASGSKLNTWGVGGNIGVEF